MFAAVAPWCSHDLGVNGATLALAWHRGAWNMNSEIFAQRNLIVHLACLVNCFVRADKEPSEVPSVCLRSGAVAEERVWWRFANRVYAPLSYHFSHSVDNKVLNSPVGRWFTNWIQTKKKKNTCFCAAELRMIKKKNRRSLIHSPDSFLIFCAVKRWFCYYFLKKLTC